jgi:hypothetical protein
MYMAHTHVLSRAKDLSTIESIETVETVETVGSRKALTEVLRQRYREIERDRERYKAGGGAD